jgi:hypothetical protein
MKAVIWAHGPLFSEVEQQGSKAELKYTLIYTSTPPYVFMAQYLISYAKRSFYLPYTNL